MAHSVPESYPRSIERAPAAVGRGRSAGLRNGVDHVDRAALPAPQAVEVPAWEAPVTAIEAVLAGLWEDILGVERVGRQDNFFVLGGHSLAATRLMTRIRSLFRVELSLRALFEAPTLKSMARQIQASDSLQVNTARIAELLLRIKSMGPEQRQKLLQEKRNRNG